MADSDKDILITPNVSQTSQPEVKFVGKDNSPMYLKVLDDNTLSFEGTEGQVFSISPTMSSGDIFSVNDISGIQSIAVNANGNISLAPVSGNVGIGTSSPGEPLHVVGTDSGAIAKFTRTGQESVEISGANGWGNVYTTDAVLALSTGGSGNSGGNSKMVINGSRVGIGTTAPTPMLHVKTDNGTTDMNSAGAAGITIEQDGAGDAAFSMLLSGTRRWMMGIDNSDSDKLKFATGGTSVDSGTALTIDTSGNVGIGTTSPMNKLQVDHTGADGDDGIMVVRADGTTTSGELLGGIGFDSTDGNVPSSILEASAGIAAYAGEDHGSSDKGGHLIFFTGPNDQNADVTSTERMRIRQSGLVEFKDDSATKTVRIQADTNSSPAPRLELMRGTHDSWGTGDNYTDWRISNENDLIFYSGFSTQSSGSPVERFRIHSDADGVTINDAYKLPASDGSNGQVLQTDGNGALSFATVSGGSDTNTFVIVGEEGDNYSGTGSTGNANGYQFSYGNGAQNVSKSSSGADFGINVPVDCTLTRVDVVFANSGNVSTGTTTFVVVKNGTNQTGNLSTNHSAGIHDTHHTGLSHSFSAGDRFNLRTTTSSRQVGPMRMTAYFTPT